MMQMDNVFSLEVNSHFFYTPQPKFVMQAYCQKIIAN